MDPVLLSRAQFGFTVGFHYLFPATTLGLALVILILETQYLRKRDETLRTASAFLIRILGIVFALGVATGIVLSVTLGTNWSSFSRIVGSIFGLALVAEGVFAFFLESAFLGVLLFGRGKVSPRMYWLSTLLVTVGAHLSGLWILIANSWMQTPAGYAVVDGGLVPTDFWAAVWNGSTAIRFVHTILGGWITGSMLVAGIAAWYLLKGRHVGPSKAMMRVAMALLIVSAVVMPLAGHAHSVQVAMTQPAKLAAYEGLWQTQAGAPLALFGVPNDASETTPFYLGIPNLLSWLVHFDPNAVVRGLNDFPAADRPPVLASFATYHVMIALGGLFLLLALAGAYLWRKGRLWTPQGLSKWYLRALVLAIPLPYLSNEVGWIAAEIGRQPWTVYGILRTEDAASVVVPEEQVLASLALLALVYGFLFVMFAARMRKIVREGPGAPDATHGG